MSLPKFKKYENVVIKISDEPGVVLENRLISHDSQMEYYVHYKDATGCAQTRWFLEELLDKSGD